MKNVIFILSIFLLASCSNGMNKSIIETLTVEELQANIKKDTTFTDFYKNVQKMREWILASDINQATYGEITYKRLKNFYKESQDTAFLNGRYRIYSKEYSKIYPDYTQQVDSILGYWKKYKEKYRLDSYVSIQFDKLWKEYYSYSGGIESVNVGFKITPLRGTIDQLVFRYDMVSKISDSGKIGYLDGKRCLASSPIRSATTLYWEAGYSDENSLKYKSNSEVKRDFNFNIEIEEIRVNGENIKEKLDEIPSSVQSALDYHLYDDMIKEFINKDYQSIYDYASPKVNEDVKQIDEDVYKMLEAYHKQKLDI